MQPKIKLSSKIQFKMYHYIPKCIFYIQKYILKCAVQDIFFLEHLYHFIPLWGCRLKFMGCRMQNPDLCCSTPNHEAYYSQGKPTQQKK